MLATEWGTGQVFLSMIWFTLFFIWIWLLILVFSDIFRSHDMNGWVKAIWVLFVIVMPYLGVFVYLIARGHKMRARHGRRQGPGRGRPRLLPPGRVVARGRRHRLESSPASATAASSRPRSSRPRRPRCSPSRDARAAPPART